MPTVPRYVQTERPRGYQNVTPTRGGEAVAGAWQQAGRALQGAGNTLNDMALDMQRRQNEAVAQEAMTAYEDLRHTFTAGVVENKKGKNALGDKNTPSVYDQSVKWHADTVTSLLEGKTDAQKKLLEPYFAKRGQSMDEWAFTYYRKQWDVYESASHEAGKKAQELRAQDDPAQFEVAMANIAQAEHNYNSARGLPEEQTAITVRASADRTADNIVKGFLEMDDPNAADAFLDKYEKQLSAGTVKALRGKSKTKRDAMAEKAEKLKEKAAKAQFEQDVATQSAEVLKQVNEFPDAEVRTAKAVELTKGIEDPKLKAAVRKAIDGTLKEQEIQGKARLVLELDALDSMLDQVGPDGTTYTPTARLAVIQAADVSEEAKRVATKSVYDQLDGKNNEVASASGLAAWRAWFDSTGGRASQEEMQAKMLDFGLNAADRKKAADYKGVRLEYPQQRVFSLIDSVFGKGKKNDAQKARMYEAIVTQAKASGKAMSDKELKALIYQQDAEGSIAGGERTWYGGVDTMTYTEAMEKTGGRVGLFRPEVPEDTAKQMRAILEYTQPWSKHLDKAGRDLLVQTTYLQQQMGIQLELTAEERQKFQNAINKYNAGNR